jgi:hypothetical protein
MATARVPRTEGLRDKDLLICILRGKECADDDGVDGDVLESERMKSVVTSSSGRSAPSERRILAVSCPRRELAMTSL